LADEPTGNLDSRNGRHVFDLMLKLNRQHNATLVLITHDHELAALADRRIALRDGRVVSDSSGASETIGAERAGEAGEEASGESETTRDAGDLETAEQRRG
jgi:putative ABC transport system ATP-binding protein